MTLDTLKEDPTFAAEPKNEIIIKVIGVGGGGNNAIEHMYRQGIKDVAFVVCNTDLQALNASQVPNKLLIGNTGLGAGNKPEVGREAAESSAEDIARLFDDGTKMVFVTAGMGGGTGTGAAPVVARIAKEKGMLTIGIVTIPFLFEGQKKILKALEGAQEMRKNVDALMIINNERLIEIYSDLNWMNGFAKADDTLTIAAKGISDLINVEGKVNTDFEDVNTTLRDGGAAIISIGYGEGEMRVSNAIKEALNSPLLKDRDIFSSKRLLFNISHNPDAEIPLAMSESNELTEFISNIDPGVDVIWGMIDDRTLGNKIKLTILAAGFDTTERILERSQPAAPKTVETANPKSTNTADDTKKIGDEYGAKAGSMFRGRESAKQIVFTPDQLNDDALIEQFEKNPTYTRDRRMVEQIKLAGKTGSRLTDATPAATETAASAPETPAAPAAPQQPRHIDFT